ncbi:MAG: hypothetical protein IJ689_05365 [Alphaproteobacteria bacterium]|nr:hypothetical protein [Alphaproteobacteria bacterium]
MKKYILMLGVASVALGSYAAYAANSATMTVTATIAHDVSLTKTGDINLGTITINPAYKEGTVEWTYNESGTASVTSGADGIVSIDTATFGTFTANVANPSACDGSQSSCSGLSVDESMFGLLGTDYSTCYFAIKYSGEGNSFKVYTTECSYAANIRIPKENSGTAKTLTISYNAG